MKKLIFKSPLLIFLFLIGNIFSPFILYGQKNIFDSGIYVKLFAKPTEVICNREPVIICNNIENNIFNTTCYGINPFWNNCVSRWNSIHGSPQLNVFGPLLASGVNHASMWSTSIAYTGSPSEVGGEGIVTGIPNLITGKRYAFSIFKRYFSSTEYPTVDLDNFYIVLMKCADYLPLRTQYPSIPDIPSNAQVIYCEKDLTNNSFQRVLQAFTANDTYDIVWIFPKQATYVPDIPKQSWLEVAKLEMININNFSAGPSPNPTFPNCNVTLGPGTPNCGVEGAIFTWYGPSGQIIPVPTNNQQIQINASNSANAGTWTLKMVVLNVVTTNNTCSNPGIVQASVNVPLCSACTPPAIWANGPLDQCVQYESPFLTFSTNITSNIQWYNNGNIIPGATGQTYTENNNPGPNWPTSTGTYFVKNTLTNCISNTLSVIRRNYSTPNVYPGSQQTTLNYCKNRIGVLHQEYSISDPNTIYRWQILDPNGNNVTGTSVILGTNNSTTYHTSISFINYPFTTATIIAGATDNGCTNTAAPYQVTIHPDPCNYFAPTVAIEKEIKYTGDRIKETNDIIIYPNPASNQITITSSETINSIEISDLMNPALKRIKVNRAKSIIVNVFDLNPGIYNCKITTSKGVENQKLIIKR